MTNYEMLQFLIEDGGWYTAAGHLKVLQAKCPDITADQVKSLRAAIQNSTLLKAKSKTVEGNKAAFKVISVDPSYNTYARARPTEKRDKFTDSYLRSEPPEVVRQILLVQQFNKLLAPVTHQRAY